LQGTTGLQGLTGTAGIQGVTGTIGSGLTGLTIVGDTTSVPVELIIKNTAMGNAQIKFYVNDTTSAIFKQNYSNSTFELSNSTFLVTGTNFWIEGETGYRTGGKITFGPNYTYVYNKPLVVDPSKGCYFITPTSTPEIDGAWRIIPDGNDLAFQRRESGVWVEKGAFTA
jgi:hypothetical protein